MTGRRSHGRLSALNGVVHQGSAAVGRGHRGARATAATPPGLVAPSPMIPTWSSRVNDLRKLSMTLRHQGSSN